VGLIRIDHVQLAAPPGCEPAARDFYGGLLGLREVPKPEPVRARGGVWFVLGDQEVHIGVDQAFTPARKAHPAFTVAGDDLEPLGSRLAEAGMDVRWDDAIPNVRRFYVADPWGNRFEIRSAPQTT
jgi:catechol 2,3-dioxygenase-like lactoylglutathione lyase family enzyme